MSSEEKQTKFNAALSSLERLHMLLVDCNTHSRLSRCYGMNMDSLRIWRTSLLAFYREIDSKIKTDPDDIKNFFEANKEKYQDPNNKKEISFENLKDRVKSDYINQKRQIAYQAYINQSLSNSDVKLFLDRIK